MTWSWTYDIVPGEGRVNETVNGVITARHEKQKFAVGEAIAKCLEYNVVGTNGYGGPITKKRVQVVAHGNGPHGEPSPGWSGEFITINISEID